ncbi:alkaline phosphatase family protein [Aureimonas leprariae]|uniref:Alkaline phosphatase family protein n=1 Tax=Plantimonas leprariae TaxID=2615207 RepID=A0A7V7PRS5_9HYPH|nr:alkaline phosphatase family protein [Aureimonas leprariae]
MDAKLPPVIGPILFARGSGEEACRLAALAVVPSWNRPPPLVAEGGEVAPARLAELFGWTAWGYDFALPARPDASYEFAGRCFPVRTDLSGDVALAFVSCNGQETGDEARQAESRNLMWRRLQGEHERRPFALLLHGGDQLYADEALDSHPEVARWAKLPPRRRPGIRWTPEMEEAVRRWFAARYLTLLAEPAMAALLSQVPSLMMWDDHDIMDGWGSHPSGVQESPVGEGIFRIAREMFALFQQGVAPDAVPPLAPDPAGVSLTLGAAFPGFRVVAPDLRSERTQTRVMGPNGWQSFERLLRTVREGERVLVVSSVPALGPRLSLLERILDRLLGTQRHEDDLRDQWQSFAHRLEWQRFLSCLAKLATARGAAVTALSGEIHLAARGTMPLGPGGVLHQLVASGISHPAPSRFYARALGGLARLGHRPLKDMPIRMHPLPGRRGLYAAERNYLVLTREAGRWTAEWELEAGGRTPPLTI